MTAQKAIKIEMKLSGGKDSCIPSGVGETLTIEVIDGMALFHFIDFKTTKRFSEQQKKDGVVTACSERLKKCICKYPGMNQLQIAEHLKNRLERMKGRKEDDKPTG